VESRSNTSCDLKEALHLLVHDRLAANHAANRGLVDHNPHLRRVISQQTEPDVLDGSRPDVRPRQDLASGLQPG